MDSTSEFKEDLHISGEISKKIDDKLMINR